MFYYRYGRSKVFLLFLILMQLCLITSYYLLYKSEHKEKLKRVSFLAAIKGPNKVRKNYYTLNDTVVLKRALSRDHFTDFNSSMCFTEGTDTRTMLANGNNWKCSCLPGWHGPDCGYPEVYFRAMLAKKQPLKLTGPNTFQRRLICIFSCDQISESLVDIRLTELGDVVDLFILYERSNYFDSQLKNGIFSEQLLKKILYIPNVRDDNVTSIWRSAKAQLRNLRDNDFVVVSPTNEIFDATSLKFLKFHNSVPETVNFRLKWVVFGFFWIHPEKTIISGGACTVAYLKESLNDNLDALALIATKSLTLGDLNRTGGWFCEYCAEPENIIRYLTRNRAKNVIDWEKITSKKITYNFIKDLIALGVYLDGKTELRRAHRYSDVDFAPKSVLDHDLKFDPLLVNFFAQSEYYM
ncbi:beta-1,4-mannosyl-glycoprotein 4-beta-N-acetylglucosaminyltransferase [Anthonomus grandis grandis]|uniref:beta-1,4-mannosyl-glycoprotein 4-beta-N-acetylglucosaminyltransferase n=1 Tax=Anthonomus grandis grandis TaxID=2921223 RepID=UPI002165937C|nr:beta-1,4-mannosyl-glycoprotein 4-beta-N-acetylglucosaminyltransferase [Anthonomus grandis grandis]